MTIRNYFAVHRLKLIALGLVLAALAAAPSLGADAYLVAKETIKTMPDGANITMWGFAEDIDQDLGTDDGEVPTAPGPPIVVPVGDDTLMIHLRNDLAVPVSIVIPGQLSALLPTSFTDSQGRDRVRSFQFETSPSGGINTYVWNDVKPGSFVYHSGYHPAVQVQMGLYGGISKDAAPGEAYTGNPNVDATYDVEVVLFLSEIDPALHAAVADGTYGTPAYPSPLKYAPKYFLVNGDPHFPGRLPIPAGSAGDRILVRAYNMSLEAHSPLVLDANTTVIAEDGNVYPYARRETAPLLPPSKTKDAIVVLGAAGTYPVFDRRFFLTDDEVPYGGMLIYLEVGP